MKTVIKFIYRADLGGITLDIVVGQPRPFTFIYRDTQNHLGHIPRYCETVDNRPSVLEIYKHFSIPDTERYFHAMKWRN